MFRFPAVLVFVFFLGVLPAFGQSEPQGIVIYQTPATTYTEALEYRIFHQDNALFSTIVRSDGQRKRVQSGGVLAVVPYPPASFDPYFADTAKTATAKIEALENTYSAVRRELEQARGKWARALAVFEQEEAQASRTPAARSAGSPAPSPAAVESARSVAMANPARPGFTRSANAAPVPLDLTGRVEAIGREVIGSCSRALGVADRTFSVWTFFVVLPALVIVLLLTVVIMARRPTVTTLPPRRSIP